MIHSLIVELIIFFCCRCDITFILIEMHRILRPGGTIIIRDEADIITKVKGITDQIKWKGEILHSENGPSHSEKLLLIDNSE